MLKKVLAGFIGFSLLSFAYAGKGTGSYFGVQPPITDTIYSDSLKDIADPKQAFKNLFVNDADASGTYTIQQLNPLAVSFVEDYIEKKGKSLEAVKASGKPYFDMMDAILSKNGLPKELKYLAVIESNLKSNARSWAGAVGPWQFMPETARNMGLRVNGKYDDRKDFTKSTYAASKYLNNLYDIYGDWLLVIAAYNGGPGKVNSAIKKSGSRDFWTLQRFLPAESKNHVKKFIATHYIMEGQGGVTTATKMEAMAAVPEVTPLSESETANSRTRSISGRYNSLVIAKHLAMNIDQFNRLNPGFDNRVASSASYDLRLPAEKMEQFLAHKSAILSESMQILLSHGTN